LAWAPATRIPTTGGRAGAPGTMCLAGDDSAGTDGGRSGTVCSRGSRQWRVAWPLPHAHRPRRQWPRDPPSSSSQYRCRILCPAHRQDCPSGWILARNKQNRAHHIWIPHSRLETMRAVQRCSRPASQPGSTRPPRRLARRRGPRLSPSAGCFA
jgi:hypothetical protein